MLQINATIYFILVQNPNADIKGTFSASQPIFILVLHIYHAGSNRRFTQLNIP